MKIYNHYVNGKEMEPNSKKYFETENPYTCEKWAKIAKGDTHDVDIAVNVAKDCLLYTSPSPRDRTRSRMPSSA